MLQFIAHFIASILSLLYLRFYTLAYRSDSKIETKQSVKKVSENDTQACSCKRCVECSRLRAAIRPCARRASVCVGPSSVGTFSHRPTVFGPVVMRNELVTGSEGAPVC